MVDAAAVLQVVALIIQAKHSKEIEFPLSFEELEIDLIIKKVHKENRHISERLTVVPGIRMEKGPGTLFILGAKRRKGVRESD